MTVNKVAGYRTMLGLGQREIAELLGISLVSYNHKENGKREFRDKEKAKLLELFKQADPNLTIDALFF